MKRQLAIGLTAAFGLACSPSSPTPGDVDSAGTTTETGGRPWFEEVAEASGVRFDHVRADEQRFWFPEIVGSGVALFDYDGDGDLDLYAVQSGDLESAPQARAANALFQNDGAGHFQDVTAAAGVGDRGYGMGCAVGDYDADGDLDLYVTNVGPNVLYRNEGGGSFVDATDSAHVGHDGWGMSSVFLDFDADGDLDLFVTNYVQWSPQTEIDCFNSYGTRDYCEPVNYNAPAPDVLFRNEGDGSFTDVTARLGLASTFGNGMGAASGDFDGDGREDLYVTNDGTANQLWLQTGQGFEDRSLLAGCAVNVDGHAEASMGVGAVDIDEDGDLDLFMTHLRGETNTLYVNQGGTFVDHTSRSGMARDSLRFTGFGMGFADFDLDGLLDLYVVNGRVGQWKPAFDDALPYAEPDQLFRGVGAGRFEEVLPRGGIATLDIANSRGLALGDLDGDGDVDIAVLDNHGPLRILRNIAERHGHWVLLRVLDSPGADAVGATLEVRTARGTRHGAVRPATSYLSSSDPRVHFGLGDATAVDAVRVRWTDGTFERFGPLEVDRVHELRRGSGQRDG